MTLPQTGAEALRAALSLLRAAGVPDATIDARRLLAHVMGVSPGRLTLVLPDLLPADVAGQYQRAVVRRAARVPVAQITGRRAFYGREFLVTPDVLDPRPETEVLVAAALDLPFVRVLDLGTGTGCILLTLLAELPGASGVGADISDAALAVAGRNAGALGLGDRVALIRSDWGADVPGCFDLVVSNPPYIAAPEMAALEPEVRDHEPLFALTDGADGLTAYHRIAADLPHLLAPGGHVLCEIGPTQAAAVTAILAAAGLGGLRVLPDLDGRDRVVMGRAEG